MKKAKVKTDSVEMISYSIKMVIPTGPYANMQPEIVVKAGTPEEAEAYIAPHMNRLWKEYFMVSEKRPEPVKTAEKANQMPPASSVAFTKASQAIDSCLSQEALDLITNQVKKSTKLTDPDKDKLMVLVIGKIKEFNGTETKK